MVLWEITLGTAYFLGLKRTYRLGLKIQRRVITPKYPKIRQFVHRRIRAVFDVALKVHQNVQQRDIAVGRNLGNWILRWLDRMKPSAQIRAPHPELPPHGSNKNMNMNSQVMKSSNQKPPGIQMPKNQESDRHLFTSSKNIGGKPFPTITMMMRPPRPAGFITQYRHLWMSRPDTLRLSYQRDRFDGVLRKDIMQWLQN